MRVLMVTPCYYPVKGGTETTVRNLAVSLNKIGVQTDVMAFNVNQVRKPKWQGKTERIDGLTIYRIPALNWMSAMHSVKVTAGVNFIPGRFTHILKNYDVIHYHEQEFSFPFFSFYIKKPKILHLHGIDYNFLKTHHISRFLLKHLAHMYIAISNQMTKELISLGIPENKITYLPNSIDTKFFKPGKQKEDNLLLFVGRLSEGKGLHVLIKSLEHLTKSVHLVIIGPPSWNFKYYQEILNIIEKVNRKGIHKIEYLGPMDFSELLKWYQKATLFILPSFYEGFPVTILEALACGTPVIATPVGGVPEIIENHKTGVLVPVSNYIQLAKAIQYLLENEDVRLKMSQEGRRLIVKRHSLEATCKKLRLLYARLSKQF